MRASLSTYRGKRRFGASPEPRGRIARPGRSLSFVIQRHAARRLHYDFRLELDGTLKSWAIPKGPSLDPAVKRMAVQTEDHPLDYASFEGMIPEGHYGAGTVIVWDRGEWIPVGDPRAGYRAGRLKFDLVGEKLGGRWNLVRMRGREDERQVAWLLIKERDDEARAAADYDVTEALPDSVAAKPLAGKRERTAKGKRAAKPERASKAGQGAPKLPAEARTAALPLTLHPQLATLVEEPPSGAGWIYEVKFDGYRVLARIDGGDVRLFTRNGNDWTARMRGLAAEVAALGVSSGWLDGEIAVLDAKGHPDFQALQRAFDASATTRVVYFVFDLPYYAGHDLRRVPLVERRAILQRLLAAKASGPVRFSEHFEGSGAKLLQGACKRGLEGLIGKRADAPYTSKRSTAWVKLKCGRRQEFVIAGYSDPKGSRKGFGSLLLGIHNSEGRLRYAGSVGTGFDDALLASLGAKLDKLATDEMPFDEKPRGVKAHWVRPKLVAEVGFTEWTGDGRIRHPVFQGLRTDKEPRTVTREKPLATAAKARAAAPTRKSAAKEETRVGGIRVSHGERVIDASSGATKLDLVTYYARNAEHILPHLAARPVALVRGPRGVGGELFFQKHNDTLRIPGIRELDPKLWPGHPAMLEIASAQALVGAAQMNAIELHTLNATAKAIDKPDRFILDLDPGEGVEWARLLEATGLVKEMLDLLEIESFLKTSGGKGLHVVVPLRPQWGWDEVKDFSAAVVAHMAKTIPQLFVAKSGASNRVGRIFIDYLRNSRGATTACAFSARARPGLGVSVPLAWKELEGLERADQWNIRNVFERLAKLRADPWKGYAAVKQTLAKAAQRLAKA